MAMERLAPAHRVDPEVPTRPCHPSHLMFQELLCRDPVFPDGRRPRDVRGMKANRTGTVRLPQLEKQG